MYIRPKKIYYVISNDETTFIFDIVHPKNGKSEEKLITIKGKFPVRTEFYVTQFIENYLKERGEWK